MEAKLLGRETRSPQWSRRLRTMTGGSYQPLEIALPQSSSRGQRRTITSALISRQRLLIVNVNYSSKLHVPRLKRPPPLPRKRRQVAGCFWGKAEIKWQAKAAGLVENDPSRTSASRRASHWAAALCRQLRRAYAGPPAPCSTPLQHAGGGPGHARP